IEQYPGPLLISAAENDTTWSSAMSWRLADRYATGGRIAELLAFPGEDHILSAEATMVRDARLSAFFAEHLA
ncbi:alpha/beta hydrolase family protein, partial [Vibrio astriarenae]